MIFDFSNPWAFVVWYYVTAIICFIAYKTKRAFPCLIPVAYFLIILAISIHFNDDIVNVMFHRICNFTGLAFTLSFYLVIDEVETRRKFISKVFKNRYSRDKKSEDSKEDQEE